MPEIVYTIAGLVMLIAVIAAGGWLLIRSLKQSEEPARLLAKWIYTLLIGGMLAYILVKWGPSYGTAFTVPFICVGMGVAMAVIWAPSLGSILARPITSLFDGGSTEIKPEPLYSIAMAKRKKGKAHEAIWEIQRQLEMFPNDLTGQTLMAEIQAEDLNDLQAAQATVRRICEQKGHPPAGVASALNLLADWHLKRAQDADAAREALEEVVRRFPDTPWSYAATQRISHLAGASELLEPHDRRPIHLEHHGESATPVIPKPASPDDTSGAREAQSLVAHLEAYPEDNEARQRLAEIYVRHYQRLDLAQGEIEQLINQPQAPARKVVQWLNLLADWQIECGADEEGARQTLQRIIDTFPNLAAAEQALNRLSHLKLELKRNAEAPVVKLGTYEDNLGLKGPPSRLRGPAE